MAMKETPKFTTKTEQMTNPNPSEDEEPEEGEIVNDEDLESMKQSSSAIAKQSHPLEHSWTLWFIHPSEKSKPAANPSAKSKQAAEWENSIRPIYNFSTVEEFWGLYNNILHPSKLGNGADLHCFKDKIEPKWEDPVCANGGKWTATFGRGKSDTSWLYTLLAMIGEQFDHGVEICGAVVNVRSRQEKISIWTKNAWNEAAQMSIGKQWREFLDYNDSMGFIFHDDAIKLDKNAKNRYTI